VEGGGVLEVFGQNLWSGVLGVVKEFFRGVFILLDFYDQVFRKIKIGVHEVPPPPIYV
jgi:hypothetical protein